MVKIKGSLRFRRKERIIRPQDFKRVMKTGKKLYSKNFIVFVKENEQQCHRLGVVVSKEVGSAAYRNRIKRVLREFFRLNKDQIRGALDIVIMAKKECPLRKYVDAKGELGRILGV